jgi:peptidoglycan/LPS O-acetylase OafA/YrhL
MSSVRNAAGSRYRTLDGLRGIGALWVVLLHFGPSCGLASPTHGYLAVDLFFCLSGFVLSRSYARKIEAGMSFGEWIAVRLIRLYPLYLLSIVLGVLATSINGMPGSQLTLGQRETAFVTALVMVPSPTWHAMPEMFPLNFVAWSLFIEMLLSVLFFWSSRWADKRLWAMLLMGILGLILTRFLIGYIGGGFAWRDAPSGFARGLFGFTAGMLIARRSTSSRTSTNAAWLPVIGAAILMSVNPPHAAAYDLAAIMVGIPAITWWGVRLEPRHGVAFALLGDVSYAVYALHSTILSLWEKISGASAEHPATMVVGLAILAAALLCCWLTDRFYDRPLRALLSRSLGERVSPQAAP